MGKVNQEKEKKRAMRMDFIHEVVLSRKCKDGTTEFVMKLTPNPKRYDFIEINGEVAFKDRFTGIAIHESALKNIKMMHGAPIFYSPPKQPDYCSYLKERKAELLGHWDEKYPLMDTQRPFEGFLSKLRGKDTQIVILYVDMAGSTRISSEVDPETNLKIIKIFLMQMAKVIDNFRGYVLKFMGDCAIGIFPADENFTSMSDNAIQAAMIMRSVVEDVINTVFVEKRLPPIGCHIGLDIGSVRVDKVGALDVAAFDDLIGYSMNLTAKIQSHAGHEEILLGRNLFELLHCRWQEHCEKLDLGQTWTMKEPLSGCTYEVYRFLGKWVCKCWDK